MDILQNADVMAAIGLTSTTIIGLLKMSDMPKKYVAPLSKLVPAIFSLLVAFMANHGLADQIMDFATIMAGSFTASTAIYKLQKPTKK